MIPAQLLADRANINNLLEYLTTELERARSERAPLEQEWIKYQRLYKAQPEEQNKTFPWPGCANVVIPVIGTDVDVTVAGLLGAIWSAQNLWSTEALRPDFIDWAARLQEFLQWSQDSELKMYDVTVDWITELCKLGTGVLKQRYLRETSMMYEWRETPGGILQQMVRRESLNRPDVRRVALADFYVPASAPSVQEAQWSAERLQLNWYQLEQRVNAGIYSPNLLSSIGYYWRQNTARTQYGVYENAFQQLDRFIPGMGDKFELFEFWTKYDIMRTGEPVSVVCTVHLPTRSYARIDFNPFFSQEKPYSAARFIRQEGRFYGIGLAEMEEMVQETVSTLENQRLDNGTIQNTTVFKSRRGSGIKADLVIYPGMNVQMENPAEDLIPMNMGQGANSTLSEEQFLLNYGQKRGGVSNYQMGGAGEPNISYSAATTTVEMLRQGRLRLDQTMREIQGALSETGQRVVELYQQFDQRGKTYMVLGQREGAMVQQVLQFPLDIIRACVAIKTTATSATLNKETQIRTNQIIFGLTTQFYQQLMQAMSIVVNPQVPQPLRQVALQMINGGLILARRTLDAYDIQDLDRILPDVEVINAIAGQLGIQPFPQPGGTGLGAGLAAPSGLSNPGGGYQGVYGPSAPPAPLLLGPGSPLPSTGQLPSPGPNPQYSSTPAGGFTSRPY